jgi:DNA-binding MltR family transcriptional regulator
LNQKLRRALGFVVKAVWKDQRSMLIVADRIMEASEEKDEATIWDKFPNRKSEVVDIKMEEMIDVLDKSMKRVDREALQRVSRVTLVNEEIINPSTPVDTIGLDDDRIEIIGKL